MKLNKNAKLMIISMCTWFLGSIILILTVKNTKIMSIIFCFMSIGLVLIIYRVLYVEFYRRAFNERKNKNNSKNNKV